MLASRRRKAPHADVVGLGPDLAADAEHDERIRRQTKALAEVEALNLAGEPLQVRAIGDIDDFRRLNPDFDHHLAGVRADCDGARGAVQGGRHQVADAVPLARAGRCDVQGRAVTGDDVSRHGSQSVQPDGNWIAKVCGDGIGLEVAQAACDGTASERGERKAMVTIPGRARQDIIFCDGIACLGMGRFVADQVDHADVVPLAAPLLGEMVDDEFPSSDLGKKGRGE